MRKYHYVLMTKGVKKIANIKGVRYGVNWNAPYYSKVKYLLANDEDMARNEIKKQLKRKWIGFMLLPKLDEVKEKD